MVIKLTLPLFKAAFVFFLVAEFIPETAARTADEYRVNYITLHEDEELFGLLEGKKQLGIHQVRDDGERSGLFSVPADVTNNLASACFLNSTVSLFQTNRTIYDYIIDDIKLLLRISGPTRAANPTERLIITHGSIVQAFGSYRKDKEQFTFKYWYDDLIRQHGDLAEKKSVHDSLITQAAIAAYAIASTYGTKESDIEAIRIASGMTQAMFSYLKSEVSPAVLFGRVSYIPNFEGAISDESKGVTPQAKIVADAKDGDIKGQYSLATTYHQSGNVKEAIKRYTMALTNPKKPIATPLEKEEGHSSRVYSLVDLWHLLKTNTVRLRSKPGRTIRHNCPIGHLLRAAKKDANAKYILGKLYEDGIYFDKDAVEAEKLFEQAKTEGAWLTSWGHTIPW
jgi:TPR repeat protein